MSELKPCPFCGTKDDIRLVYDFVEHPFDKQVRRVAHVYCRKCGAYGGSRSKEFSGESYGDAAAEAWNRRARAEGFMSVKKFPFRRTGRKGKDGT